MALWGDLPVPGHRVLGLSARILECPVLVPALNYQFRAPKGFGGPRVSPSTYSFAHTFASTFVSEHSTLVPIAHPA